MIRSHLTQIGLFWHDLLACHDTFGFSSSWRLFDGFQPNTTLSWVSFRWIESHLTYILYLYTWSVRRCVWWALSEYVTFVGLFSINQVSRNIHSVHIHSERQAAWLMVTEQICLFYMSLFSYVDLFWHAFCACALGAVGDVPRKIRLVHESLFSCNWSILTYILYVEAFRAGGGVFEDYRVHFFFCMGLFLLTFGLFWHTRHMSTHAGDQTENIWISRFYGFTVNSLKRQGLRSLTWNPVSKFGDSRENVFDMYGDSCENSLEILAVVII